MQISEIRLSERGGLEKLVQLLNAYYRTPTGGSGGAALAEEIRDRLFSELPRYRCAGAAPTVGTAYL